MKTNTKWWLFWVSALFVAAVVAVGLEWTSGPPETAEEKRLRYWRGVAERQMEYARTHPEPPPRVSTPEERIESSVRRTESMVRDIESKQAAMEREMEFERLMRPLGRSY